MLMIIKLGPRSEWGKALPTPHSFILTGETPILSTEAVGPTIMTMTIFLATSQLFAYLTPVNVLMVALLVLAVKKQKSPHRPRTTTLFIFIHSVNSKKRKSEAGRTEYATASAAGALVGKRKGRKECGPTRTGSFSSSTIKDGEHDHHFFFPFFSFSRATTCPNSLSLELNRLQFSILHSPKELRQ